MRYQYIFLIVTLSVIAVCQGEDIYKKLSDDIVSFKETSENVKLGKLIFMYTLFLS